MDNELDEGKVEKARAAFEAMTKAMLDAGRRLHRHRVEAMTCDHDHDDGLGMLTARDIPTPDRPVEQERDEFERRYATVLRNLNVAQQERDRLRAGIERIRRLVRTGFAVMHPHTHEWLIDLEAEADTLAGSGEQPGEADRAYAEGRWCGECRYGQVEDPPCCTRPAPVVPDSPGVLRVAADAWEDVERAGSPDVRERLARAFADHHARRTVYTIDYDHADVALAVVGQGVTAEVEDEECAPDCEERAACDKTGVGHSMCGRCEHGEPRHHGGHFHCAAVRPTGQEQADG